ncbi:MAG: hypothetical protein U9P79_06765, partial [Candidatus Cloacimonadota bacterium]|nr:hypothetical protein [Candidatus Cloacimonadota bacterium]
GKKNVRIDDDVLIVRGFFTTSWGAYRMFTIGLRIPEEIFQALVIHIRECGKILQKINKKKKWEENETIKI